MQCLYKFPPCTSGGGGGSISGVAQEEPPSQALAGAPVPHGTCKADCSAVGEQPRRGGGGYA